jgi:hypothetical protein
MQTVSPASGLSNRDSLRADEGWLFTALLGGSLQV